MTILDDTMSYVAPAPGAAVVTSPVPVITVPSLNATVGVPTGTIPIATFTVTGSTAPASQFTATIDWGDKTAPDLGVVSQSGTTYTVTGGHTYAQVGAYTITVTVQEGTNPPARMTGQASVTYSTTTTLSPPVPNPSANGQQVTFVATVTTSTATSPPVGEAVTFLDGTTSLGTAPLNRAGQATFVTSTLAPGMHSISAAYGGDATYGASTAPPVTQTVLGGPALLATTTALTSSLSPTVPGQAVTFTAIVTPVAGSASGVPTGTVTFTIDGAAQTPVSLAVVGGNDEATLTIANLAAGTHAIIAIYNGNSTFASSTSTSLTQVVNQAPPPAVVAIGRFGYHAQSTSLVAIFSQPLDPARAQNVAAYQLVTLVRQSAGRLRPGPKVAITRAVYNPLN
jgi:hypothetical protein